MKIASFCFHLKQDQVGGAQIPAIAFKKWAELFNIECDLVTHSDFCTSELINPDIPCQVKIIDNEQELNEYQAVFFSTVDHFGGSNFDFDKITIPRASMAHAEFDNTMFGGLKRFYSVMKTAQVPIVIGTHYWKLRGYEYLWYPCCFPEYLINGAEQFPMGIHEGILYSARLSDWKNAHLLAMLSKIHQFRDSVGYKISVFGKANKPKYQDLINDINPNWNEETSVYNVYDYPSIAKRNSQHQYIWEVSGANDYWFELYRFNLSAVEGMKFGLVPIAHIDAVHDVCKRFTIDIKKILSNPGYLSKINHGKQRQLMFNHLLDYDRAYTYNSVESQIERILNDLVR